jgi:CheY-like chemotaxis protein
MEGTPATPSKVLPPVAVSPPKTLMTIDAAANPSRKEIKAVTRRMETFMQPRALLVSQNENDVRVLTRSFVESGILVELCTDPQRTSARLRSGQFQAAIVDANDRPGARAVLAAVQDAPIKHKPLVIVLTDKDTDLAAVFSAGVQLAIYRPITFERVRDGVRAARNLMIRERRTKSPRVPVQIMATLTVGSARGIPIRISDVSETGASISGDYHLHLTQSVFLEFLLPDSVTMVKVKAEVVWRNVHGQLGLRFVANPCAAALADWLRKNVAAPRRFTVKVQKAGAALSSAVA